MALFQQQAAQDVGEKLRRRRAELGWTQEVAAEKVGVTLRALQRWEAGTAIPRDLNVFKLAKAYAMKPSEIAEGAEGQPTQLDRIEKKLDQALNLLAQRRVGKAAQTARGKAKTAPKRRRRPASSR